MQKIRRKFIMPEKTVETRVKAIIKEVLKIDESRLAPEARLKEDLGADSLDLATLAMALEEEFKGSILDSEFERMKTIGQAVETITQMRLSASLKG
jgi:acyl carrier protein